MSRIRITIDLIQEKQFEKVEYQRIADSGNDIDGKAVYGYVSAGIQTKDEEITVYKQILEVDTITHIIAAANKLKE